MFECSECVELGVLWRQLGSKVHYLVSFEQREEWKKA